MLPSGLPDHVADEEDLARFLTSNSQYSARGVKPGAYLPAPKEHETSVFRHGSKPLEILWEIADLHVGETRSVRGAAIVRVRDVRAAALDVIADEPPPRHAAIRGWPSIDDDPDLQKARWKVLAAQIAASSNLVRR